MTPKHLSCRAVETCRSEPRVDRGVLDVGMSQTIFHKCQISAGVKQVCRNRMLQAMEPMHLLRKPRRFSTLLHQLPEHKPANRHITIRYKEIRQMRYYSTVSSVGPS